MFSRCRQTYLHVPLIFLSVHKSPREACIAQGQASDSNINRWIVPQNIERTREAAEEMRRLERAVASPVKTVRKTHCTAGASSELLNEIQQPLHCEGRWHLFYRTKNIVVRTIRPRSGRSFPSPLQNAAAHASSLTTTSREVTFDGMVAYLSASSTMDECHAGFSPAYASHRSSTTCTS